MIERYAIAITSDKSPNRRYRLEFRVGVLASESPVGDSSEATVYAGAKRRDLRRWY